MEPGQETPNSGAQRMALPGFALVTTPSPQRSRWRYMPVAVASLAAIFLFNGVMEENRSTRESVAELAQVDDVRIDPDHLPVALVEYPATVTGQTSDGQKVRCTIRVLNDEERPSCIIPLAPAAIPKAGVRVDGSMGSTPTVSAVPPPTQRRDDAPVTLKPPAAVSPTPIATPTDDDQDSPDGRPTRDDGNEQDARDDRDGRDDRDARDEWGERDVSRAMALTGSGASGRASEDDNKTRDENKAKDENQTKDEEKGQARQSKGPHDKVKG